MYAVSNAFSWVKFLVFLIANQHWLSQCLHAARLKQSPKPVLAKIYYKLCHPCHWNKPEYINHMNSFTHWGRVTHVCIRKLTMIDSDNGLLPGHCQATIWTDAGILLIGPLGTNFNEILIKIHTFSFKKIHWKMSSGKGRPFCLGLNVLSMPIYPQQNKTEQNHALIL